MDKNKYNLELGDRVYWNDPEGLTSAWYILIDINLYEGTCLLVNKLSETEALISELSESYIVEY